MDAYANSPVLAEIARLVEEELCRQAEHQPSRAAGLLAEKQQLQTQMEGWLQSLGRPDLNSAIRQAIESNWADANGRIAEIDQDLALDTARQRRQEISISPEELAERLKNLESVLTSDNATLTNFELSLHIDAIECDNQGHIEMRTCKLGIVPDIVAMLREFVGSGELTVSDAEPYKRRQPRRRTRLALSSPAGSRSAEEQDRALDFALDPRRFEGLPDSLFWVDTFEIPPRLSWAEIHAEAVFKRWKMDGVSQAKLAKEFDVSIPTIRQAIRKAEARLSSAAAPDGETPTEEQQPPPSRS